MRSSSRGLSQRSRWTEGERALLRGALQEPLHGLRCSFAFVESGAAGPDVEEVLPRLADLRAELEAAQRAVARVTNAIARRRP